MTIRFAVPNELSADEVVREVTAAFERAGLLDSLQRITVITVPLEVVAVQPAAAIPATQRRASGRHAASPAHRPHGAGRPIK